MHLTNVAKMVMRANKLEEEFQVDSVWTHRNGRAYTIVGIANIANWNARYRPVIVYKSVVPTASAFLPSRLWTKTPRDFRLKMKKITNNRHDHL